MRSTVYFFPPRTSVTDSVGISTRPIFSSSPKARTRDSNDSFTLRSNPEYEWMMYHFILGLRGCSATTVAPSEGGAPASVVLLFASSCMIQNPLALLREKTKKIIYASPNHVIDNPEINSEQKHSDDHNRRSRLHFFARRRSDFAHFRAHVVIKSLDALGPGLDPSAKTRIVGCCD